MLKIREQQIKALEAVAAANFEREMVAHISEFAPGHLESLKEEGILEVVRLGIERAKEYGFTKRGPIRFYIELTFMFGSDFDIDFQLPWAEQALKDESTDDELARADRLHQMMLEYAAPVLGKENEHLIRALRKLNGARMDDYQIGKGNFETFAVIALRKIYPEKSEYLGPERIEKLLSLAEKAAAEFSITAETGKALLGLLILILGQGVFGDPIYPWIRSTLEDQSIPEPNDRAARLEEKTKIYLDRSLKSLEERRK